jgi:broad specificity phosphatase PhoE
MSDQTNKTRKKELYFIRHGQTDWNNLHKAQGCENDIPLNDNGREQAKKTGFYLANYRLDSGSFDLIVSSGMERAHETATIIAEKVGYKQPILVIDEFKEKCHGKLGGKTDEELKADQEFKEYIDAIIKLDKELDPIKQREIYYSNNKLFAKLYQTELYKDFRKRVKNGLKQIYDRPEEKIIIVSHGGTIMQLLQLISGIDDYIVGDFKNGHNCHISYIKLYEKLEKNKIRRRAKIIKLLNTQHLKPQIHTNQDFS